MFGRNDRYTIYDQGDMRHVVDWLLSDADRNNIQRALAEYGQPAGAEVLAEISRAKNLLLTPESYERCAAVPAAPLIAAVWREAEVELRRSNAFEFDDLLACAVRLLGEHPHRLRWLRQRWRWIMVDEFQDTSHAQAALVDLLAGPDGNLCVVGDDDQLIHGWRHADPRHILGFAERHPVTRRSCSGGTFARGRRSCGRRSAASVVTSGEPPKTLIAMRGPGGEVRVARLVSEHHEAHWVAGQIAEALAGGVPPGEILLLARTGYATEPLQRALAHAGIPHRVLGSLGLYERTEVRDALAYLTLVQNPHDVRAFARAIGSPRRGVGNVTVTRLVTWARERHGGDLIIASAHAGALEHGATQAARTRLSEFGAGVHHVGAELAGGRSLGHAVIATVTMPGGLVRHHEHERDHSPNGERRSDAERVLEDLRSLCRAAQSLRGAARARHPHRLPRARRRAPRPGARAR